MNVTCASCQTIFRVDPAKVPTRGVRARCSVCGGVFWVRHPVAGGPSTQPPPREAARPAPAPPPVARAAPARPPAQPEPSRPTAGGPAPRPAMPPGPVLAPIAAGASPAPAAPARPTNRPAGPAIPPRPAVSAPTGQSAAPPPSPRPREPMVASAPSQPASVPTRPAVPPSRPRAAPSRPAQPPAQSVVPPATRSAPSAAATQPKKRRVNPFLSQDPDAKARRLARALISDMVVYHPAKRREGLQHGTLKHLFEEEVKKSWEEYVDQVGNELAEATPYFHDALNEILADGHSVFP